MLSNRKIEALAEIAAARTVSVYKRAVGGGSGGYSTLPQWKASTWESDLRLSHPSGSDDIEVNGWLDGGESSFWISLAGSRAKPYPA